jgi:hypothetical protein
MSHSTAWFQTIFNRQLPQLALAAAFAMLLSLPALNAQGQQPDNGTKDPNLDVHSSVGDLHMGKDADARSAGLPLYPGAHLRPDEPDSDALNFGVLTESFGVKLVIAKYGSDDAPNKIVDFYREKLKKYGKVLECHTSEHSGSAHADVDDQKQQPSKALKCEGDNTGPVTELKVGTEDNEHVVAIEPSHTGKGTIFALVYMHSRGKQGDI